MGKRDDLMISVDCFFGKCYNLLLNIKQSHIDSKLNKVTINKNSDIIFIIGNGPSLNDVNLDKIRNFDSLTVNGFYCGNKDFKSNFHLLYDLGFEDDEYIDLVNCAIEKNPDAVFLINNKFSHKFKKFIAKTNKYISFSARLIQVDKYIKYDMNKEMTGSLNVIPIAIQCAMSMGYKKIFLLGCDFSLYTKVNGAHFYDSNTREINVDNSVSEPSVGNLIRCSLVHKHHYAIYRTCKRDGIEIFNATKGSLIDAYPFINFENYIDGFNYENA